MHRRRRRVNAAQLVIFAAVLATITWSVVYHLHAYDNLSITLGYYLFVALFMVYTLGAALKGRTFTHLMPAEGTVVAIVPSYEEDPELLRATVLALINQTRPPDEIHVVDDGSIARPTVTINPDTGEHEGLFEHPRVTWYRQDNQGKRHAQANILRLLEGQGRHYDFIVTVDSDSVLHHEAVEQVLRPMSNRTIQAATGLTLVANRERNLLTRVIDVELYTWCTVTRMARSLLGAVAPTSGILAIYRSELVMDNLDDYVRSGTAGDDRRLTHYALQRGKVVAVNEAMVYSEMPHTLKGLWKQRVRWFKSYWRYVPWELENFPLVPLLFRLYSLLVTVVLLGIYLWIIAFMPGIGKLVFLQGLGYWVILTYAQTAMYAIGRPDVKRSSRILAWLFLTPLISLLNMLWIRPAMYYAVTKARNTEWMTRGALLEPAPAAAG